jgi:hypothetical protein
MLSPQLAGFAFAVLVATAPAFAQLGPKDGAPSLGGCEPLLLISIL